MFNFGIGIDLMKRGLDAVYRLPRGKRKILSLALDSVFSKRATRTLRKNGSRWALTEPTSTLSSRRRITASLRATAKEKQRTPFWQ